MVKLSILDEPLAGIFKLATLKIQVSPTHLQLPQKSVRMTLVYVAYNLQCQKFQSVYHKAYSSFRMVLVCNDTNYSFHFMMLY